MEEEEEMTGILSGLFDKKERFLKKGKKLDKEMDVMKAEEQVILKRIQRDKLELRLENLRNAAGGADQGIPSQGRTGESLPEQHPSRAKRKAPVTKRKT